jgi:serine/threonine protein kinase/tetratricopeptide (TPR) repeat protein
MIREACVIGKTISHYKILEKLGEGGMGVVYKAEDTKLKRTVALKFLPPELTRDEQAKKRFIIEAQAASALDHPHICTIYEIDETEDGRIFIVMAYYEGETLKEKIESGSLGIDEAVDVSIQIAKGLSRAHESGITHRDMKPANVMITKRGEAKIVDFGLAKLAGQTKLTKKGTTLGTVAYMSPEQTKGKEVGHQTDLWSLGVMLYEMITGHLPFNGDYEQAVIYSILNEEPEPVSSLSPGAPAQLQAVLERLLAKDPAERYRTADELLGELQKIKDSMPGLEIRRAQRRTKAPRGKRTSVYAYSAIVIILAAVSFMVAYILFSRRSNEPVPGGAAPGRTSSEQAVDVTAWGREKGIVVLPFEDISPGRDNEYFSDGLTEEIITDLSKVHSLRVISRTSAMQFKGTEKNVRTIGGELKVRYVLEGSVRKAGDELRITAQLIDASNDSHVWAEKYSGTMDDVFDMQEKVSRAIVSALEIKLNPEEDRKIAAHPINNVRAFEYYLKAKEQADFLTEEALGNALKYLQSGLDIIGGNVLIYAGMGFVYWQYFNIGIRMDEAYLQKTEEYARKIFELEPDSPYGHLLLGLLSMTRGKPQESVNHFKLVLAQDPSNVSAMEWLTIVYAFAGKPNAANSINEKLREIDPLNRRSSENAMWISSFEGRWDLAFEHYRWLYKRDPSDFRGRIFLAMVLFFNERFEEANTVIEQLAVEFPQHYITRLLLFLKFSSQGDKSQVERYMTPEFVTISKRDWQYSWMVAAGYSLLGENEKSLDWLENAVNLGFINYPYFSEYDPFLKSIRGEARFKELMRRVKREWEDFAV